MARRFDKHLPSALAFGFGASILLTAAVWFLAISAYLGWRG